MSDPFYVVVATLFGAIIGSFLNAVIYRMPRRHEQQFDRRSICPHCGARIPGWHNIPILSWIWLRGRAACCGKRISVRYPIVEALTAGLFFMVAYYAPAGLPLESGSPSFVAFVAFVLHAYFVSNLVANTFIDFDFRILPDRLTKPLMVVGVVGSFLVPGLAGTVGSKLDPMVSSVLASSLGLAVGFGMTWGIQWLADTVFRKPALGFGDVKLMGGVGAFLGWDGSLLTFFLGCLSGALFGVVHKIITKDSYIAFGPFLCLGAIITLFAGDPITHFLTVTWPEWQHQHMSSPLVSGGVAVVSLFLLIVLVRRGRNS